MSERKGNLTQATRLMLKLAQEANVLALEVALDAAKGSSTHDRLLKIAEEIKKLADQAIEVRSELVICIMEVRELEKKLSRFGIDK